jgi:hypothetical protein
MSRRRTRTLSAIPLAFTALLLTVGCSGSHHEYPGEQGYYYTEGHDRYDHDRHWERHDRDRHEEREREHHEAHEHEHGADHGGYRH